jgi:asparagine N-glycosylation enzyme membrane subunit Stt3
MALGAGLLLVSHRMRRGRARVGRRVAEVALAGAIAGAAVASIPGVLAGVRQGLAAAGAANAWYRTITEFWPLIGSGFVPLQRELVYPVAFFGLGFLVLPLAAIGLRREWVERPDRRGALLFLWGWCAVSLVASLARTRFMLYLAVPLAVCAAAWLERVARRAGSRAELAIAAGAMAIVAPAYAFYQKPAPATDAPLLETVRWIADAELRNARPGAVLAPWTNGHAVRAAGLPVVGSPFGTDVSARSLEDEAAFFCTFSSEEARAIADERRVDFVIVRQPIDVVWSLQDLRPRPDRRGADGVAAPLVTEVHSTWAWMRLDPGAEFSRTIMARLFYGDGMASRRHAEPALGWVRLVREEFAPEPSGLPDVRQTKTFSVVRGALLRVDGARPGAAVLASARITTNVGRAFVWTTQATADATGSASLRVPYATGANGTSSALAYEVRDGEQQATVNVAEAAVTTGSEIVVALSGARGSRPRGAPDR